MIITRRFALTAILAVTVSVAAVARLRPAEHLRATPTAPVSAHVGAATSHARRGHARTLATDTIDVVVPVPTAPVRATTPIHSRRAAGIAGTYRREGEAEPKSLQIINVPVPTRFGHKQVDFEATPSGRADILSARHGTLPESPADTRATTVVARVPAGVGAGPLEVAQVEFADDTSRTVVSVELVIARVRRLTLRSTRPTTAVYPGSRLHLDLIVQNLGNSPDTLVLAADAIRGWKIDPSPTIILAPGEQRQVSLAVRTPPAPASGDFPLMLRAHRDTLQLASVMVPVSLLPDPTSEQRTNGPVLVAGLATSAGDSIGGSPVLSLAVDGPLTQAVALRGRLIHATDRADFNTYAMSRIGYFLDASFLNATGAGWSATVGRTGYSFSPIFGWNAYGLGTSADLTSGQWNFGLLAVQERIGGRSGGDQFGARVGRHLGAGVLNLTATHLEQSLVFAVPRTLDATGLTYQFSPRAGLTLTGEAGYRQSEAGTGAAFSGKLDRTSSRGQFSLYAAHAPGGSGAFARATDELNGSLWRTLSPSITLRAFGYGSNDAPGTGSTSKTRGVAGGPTFRVGRSASIDVDLSTNKSEFFNRTLGRLGSGELMATVGSRVAVGDVNVRASVGGGRSTRDYSLPTGLTGQSSGGRLVLRGGADTYTAHGTFSVDAGLEKNQSTTGQIPSVATISLQGSRLRFFSGPRSPLFDAQVWMNSYAGAPKGGPAVRLGTDIPLPSQFALTIDVERNPYLHAGGATPWVAAIRFERAIGLPGVRRPNATGSVFDDRNGNGTRDRGEPGLGGVLVRRGAQSILSAPDGSFKFYEPAAPNAAPIVDMSSLSAGQMAPMVPTGPGVKEWDLPVVRTGHLRVELLPALDSLGRFPSTRLDQLLVTATDSTGAIWIAHPDSNGVALFDALPAGHYTVNVDLSASLERLRPLQTPPNIEITSGEDLPPVRLKFGFRAMRVFDGTAPGSGGRRRR